MSFLFCFPLYFLILGHGLLVLIVMYGKLLSSINLILNLGLKSFIRLFSKISESVSLGVFIKLI